MRTIGPRATLLVALVMVSLGVWSISGNAALPPQYDRWNEFAAIIGDTSIPGKLGIQNLVDRIERTGEGRYRVHSGKCFVPITVSSRAPTGPQGQPIVGGSVKSV